MEQEQASVTQLLNRLCAGEADVFGEIYLKLEPELRLYAHRILQGQRPDATLRSTALVNEVVTRLLEHVRDGKLNVEDRTHFVRLFANMVHTTFLDELRKRYAQKRGSGAAMVDADKGEVVDDRDVRYASLSIALKRLRAHHPRACAVFVNREESGWTVEETAELLGVSAITVRRDYSLARGFLRGELGSVPIEMARRFIFHPEDDD